MARIRTIKPEYWTDEKVGSLKRDERLLFIGLWNLADDQGVVKSNPAYIKGQLFSYDEDLRMNAVQSWLASLTKARLLIPFSHKDEGYFLIRTFHEHQLINRPSKPKFTSELIQSILMNTHGVLTECSQPEKEGKGDSKGTGKGEADKPPPPSLKNPFDEKFLTHWEEWKAYKKSQHKFSFKDLSTEQTAIDDLFKISAGNQDDAAAIIKKSIANGWKGLFELKQFDRNGNKHSGAASKSATATAGRSIEFDKA